jgi:hypothetical protein
MVAVAALDEVPSSNASMTVPLAQSMRKNNLFTSGRDAI